MGRGFLARARGARLAALPVVLAAVVAAILIGCTVRAQSAPTVTSVEVTSNAGADNTYAFGERIIITVRFSQDVTVTGTPQIKIDMDPADWGEKTVNYTGTVGDLVLFVYTVVEPNYSTQGIAVLANSLSLNGGTIRSSSGTNAVLTHTGLDHDPEHKVNWQLAPAPPSNTRRVGPQSLPTATPTATPTPGTPPPLHPTLVVTQISIVEKEGEHDLGPGTDRVFGLCDEVYIDVTFNRALNVGDPNTDGNVPQRGKRTELRLLLDSDSDPVSARHYYGLGSTARFLWVVGGTDYNRDANPNYTCPDGTREVSYDGIAFPANAVTLGAAETWTIPSPALGPNRNFQVDSTVPQNTSAHDLDCAVNLTAAQVDTYEIGLSWTVDNGYVFCDAGGWFVDVREDGGTWGSQRVPGPTSYRKYHHGGAQYGVDYAFRVRAVDGRGRSVAEPDAAWTTTSNVVGFRLTGAPPSLSATLYGPGLVRATWLDANESHLDSLDGYLLRYRKATSPDWTTLPAIVVCSPKPCEQPEYKRSDNNRDIWVWEVYLEDLPYGEYYVQAGTQATIDGQSQVLWGREVFARSRTTPHRIWFIDDSPVTNLKIGRIFMTTRTNYAQSSATCNVNNGTINCPPGTLVSLNVYGGGVYDVAALATTFGVTVDCSVRPALCTRDEHGQLPATDTYEFPTISSQILVRINAAGAIRYLGASGGDGKIVMSWSPVAHKQIGQTFNVCADGSTQSSCETASDKRVFKNKELDSVIVEYRRGVHGVYDGWTSVRVDPTLTRYELTGLPYGTYQVRVRPCMATVEIVNGVETGDLLRCMSVEPAAKEVTIEYREVNTTYTVYGSYEDPVGVLRGQNSPVVTLEVAPDHTGLPGPVTSAEITRTGRSVLSATWFVVPYEGGAAIYDYRVRYRPVGSQAWSYVLLHSPPYDITCRWSANGDCLPTGNREITGVFGSGAYEVEIQSRNANGESAWLRLPNVA